MGSQFEEKIIIARKNREKVCYNCKHNGLYQENKGRDTAIAFLLQTESSHCWKDGKSVNPLDKEKCFEEKKLKGGIK